MMGGIIHFLNSNCGNISLTEARGGMQNKDENLFYPASCKKPTYEENL
jgi:hypothetical protein